VSGAAERYRRQTRRLEPSRHQLDVSDAARARRLSPLHADVFCAWAFRPLADIELDGLAFAQLVEADTLHATLMEEILLPLRVRNEPEAFVCFLIVPVIAASRRVRRVSTRHSPALMCDAVLADI